MDVSVSSGDWYNGDYYDVLREAVYLRLVLDPDKLFERLY